MLQVLPAGLPVLCLQARCLRHKATPGGAFAPRAFAPLRCWGGLGSKGAIFCHCASVSNGRDRAISPPSALLTLLISHFAKHNHHVLKRL